ncbi:MAG: tetratricopeptide repeat protein, partial [Muribaculaceae bacterium]|nr:tetratricopeptide repeat protein [Muribaculaceae bacterium]
TRPTYNYKYAGFEIKRDSLAQAIPYLQAALKDSSSPQKTRIHFLLGQIYARMGEKDKAYKEFHDAGKSSSASYRTKFNARIKQSEVYSGADVEPEVKALKRMVRYDRNKDYLDQVYYAIGNLYLSRGDTLKAMENYRTAVDKSTRSGIEKAIVQVTLGNLYFDRHEYADAQPCYSQGVPMLPETYPDYKTLRKRSDVLDELAIYSQNVKLQDSLLHLAAMPEEKRMEVIDGIIKRLKEQEEREAAERARDEYLAEQQAIGSNLQTGAANAPNSFVLNADNSWYFYNQATRNAGRTEFQRRWGSRKLEDDWRRRNKATFSTSDFDTENEDDDENENEDEENNGSTIPDENNPEGLTNEELARREAMENDPHYPEYYLKQIPSTEAEKAQSNEIIQEGLYNMGVILKDKLEDFNAARSEFDRLLTEYPDNIYRPEVYYNLYLMLIREHRRAEAEYYRQLILSEFPESKYGIAMRDPEYIDKLLEMDERQEALYSQTYEDYLNNRNDRVHAAYDTMTTNYPLSKIMPKFMFLHALAFVTEKNADQFNATL